MLTRLFEWFRSFRQPPTPGELEAREEAQELLDEKDTIRVLGTLGPKASRPTPAESTTRASGTR